jgi:DNA-binding GntR family transcriptional regulator
MPRPRKDSPAVTLPPPAPELRDLPLAQVAERNLRLLVLDGPLRPGVIAPIGEIARRLETGRQPIRDAAARLATDGLLEIVPQIGCRVPFPAPAVVADFFLFFAAAEALVARLGAERRTPDEARAFNLAQALEIEAAAGGPADCDPRYRAINRAF